MAKVMLALSTFRRSEKAEEVAFERAAGGELSRPNAQPPPA